MAFHFSHCAKEYAITNKTLTLYQQKWEKLESPVQRKSWNA